MNNLPASTQQLVDALSKLGLQALPLAKVLAIAYIAFQVFIFLVVGVFTVWFLYTFIRDWNRF